jgi:hypothetical protein
VNQIARYYQHYAELAASAMKDQQKLNEWLRMIRSWQETAERLGKLLV